MTAGWSRTAAIVAVQLESIVGRHGTRWLALLTTIALVVTTVGILGVSMDATAATTRFLGGAASVALIIAALLPGLVWHRLPPGGRLAMHSLPIDRKRHELLRAACGAMLLLLVTVTLVAVGALLQWRIAPPVTWPGPMAWLTALLSTLLMYAIGSVAGVLTRSATSTLLRIVVWGFAAALVLTAVGQQSEAWLAGLERLGHAVLWGPFGVWTALTAGSRQLGDAAAPSAVVALAVWWSVALAGLVVASGRVPRGGRA